VSLSLPELKGSTDPYLIAGLSDKKALEKYSSAFTLSDMEIFIFPELFYPLVLANIMSPQIWEWKKDPWFSDMENKGFNYKVNRIKQYIIQNYVFNLDLSTWGLTTKSREIERFREFFDMDLLKQSNALFGYEGDKYYFDIDIRKHFGLDKFDSEIIPYWKTETIEAMTAFRHKGNFTTGAGECVSLSALYAAAMFVIGKIPLEKIFLIATPLHSQNFITEKDGLLTNNRRIVSKNMWFNGTSLSEKARRALENEKVTIVSHISGYVHTIYRDATIGKEYYDLFSDRLKDFLVTKLNELIFINFLRFKSKYKSLFQFECDCTGIKRYISLEKMFEYEHSSKHKVSPETRAQLVQEIEGDEFYLSPLQDKILLNTLEDIIRQNHGKSLKEIEGLMLSHNGQVPAEKLHEMFQDLSSFISTDPKLPDNDKNYIGSVVPEISVDDDRHKILSQIIKSSNKSETALLALYVYRDMDRISWVPFIKAAVERNPVCLLELEGKTVEEVNNILTCMYGHSIYDDNRLAQPDEVWNFQRGDGIEKALLLTDFILHKSKTDSVTIKIGNKNVDLNYKGKVFNFHTSKSFRKSIEISGKGYTVS
jgi:hypothetical protein